MEFKKKDFILVTVLDGQKVLGLRPDYFDDKAPIGEALNMEDVAEALDELKTVDEVIIAAVKLKLPTEEELAEIEKEKKRAELKEALKALD